LEDFNSDFCYVFLRYNGILRFGVQVCLLVIWSFAMVEDEICAIENGVDEVLPYVSTIPF